MMDAAEEYREACRKFKAATQAKLCDFLIELERLGLEQEAAQVRPLAIEPEKSIATGNEWHYLVWETTREISRTDAIPDDLRKHLGEFAQEVNPRYNGPGANNSS
jgi:hypothetical protein